MSLFLEDPHPTPYNSVFPPSTYVFVFVFLPSASLAPRSERTATLQCTLESLTGHAFTLFLCSAPRDLRSLPHREIPRDSKAGTDTEALSTLYVHRSLPTLTPQTAQVLKKTPGFWTCPPAVN